MDGWPSTDTGSDVVRIDAPAYVASAGDAKSSLMCGRAATTARSPGSSSGRQTACAKVTSCAIRNASLVGSSSGTAASTNTLRWPARTAPLTLREACAAIDVSVRGTSTNPANARGSSRVKGMMHRQHRGGRAVGGSSAPDK
eukprot:2774229-Prymnesium_polylepis.1